MTSADPTASWLPVHHDMGLIGCLVTPVVNGSDLWAMRPQDFVQSPLTWLGCFWSSACRVKPELLAGMNFSEWRTGIVPSVASGYVRNAGQSPVTTTDRTLLRTGSIRRRARTVFAEDLEASILEIPEMTRVRRRQ